MVVAVFIITLFFTFLFRAFLTADSGRISVTRRAQADDIALSNLHKINTKTDLTSVGGAACDTSTGGGNVNNLMINPNATGSTIAWGGVMQAELTTGTMLPPGTTQTLVVLYPQGCGSNVPAEIQSTVNYVTESVVRAGYVN